MMTKERFKETNYKMSYEEYMKCYCGECKKQIVSIEMHIEECLKLMVDLVYVLT